MQILTRSVRRPYKGPQPVGAQCTRALAVPFVAPSSRSATLAAEPEEPSCWLAMRSGTPGPAPDAATPRTALPVGQVARTVRVAPATTGSVASAEAPKASALPQTA